MALVMIVSMTATAGPAIAADSTVDVDQIHTQSVDSVDVDGSALTAIESVDGDNSELYVRFDPEGSETGESVDDDSVEGLQEEARTTQASFQAWTEETDGIDIAESFWLDNAVLVEVDTDRVTISDIAGIDGVDEIHANYEVKAPKPVDELQGDDPDADNTTYGVDQVNAANVWEEFDATGENVTVAVIDTGIDPDHPEFEEYDTENWAAFGFSGEKLSDRDPRFAEPFDDHFHGTHVAGTIAGGDADGASIGVAPDAELYAINVFPDPNSGTTLAAIVAGLEHAVQEDTDVANLSLGGSGFAAIYVDVVKNAMDAGTLVVSASGNEGVGSTGTPANAYDGLSVGATDEEMQVAAFSTGDRVDTEEDWGPIAHDGYPDEYKTPDVSAPGVLVASAVPEHVAEESGFDEPYARASGTSMAAPHTSGIAALLMSKNDLDAYETKTVLQETATKPHEIDISHRVESEAAQLDDEEALTRDDRRDVRYGFGVADAYAAFVQLDEDISTIEGQVVAATEIELVMQDGSVETLAGEGEPLEAVEVAIDDNGIRDTRTDDDGEFVFDVIDGTYELSLTDPGFSGSTDIEVDGDEEPVTIDADPVTGGDLFTEHPREVASGEPIEFDVLAIETDEYKLDIDESTDDTAAAIDQVELTYNGTTETVEPGESVPFDETFTGEIGVVVHTDDGTPAGTAMRFEHTFVGPDGEVSGVTGPTELRGDDAERAETKLTAVDGPNDETVFVDEDGSISVTVENPGDFTEQVDVGLVVAVDGQPVGDLVQRVEIAPSADETVTFDLPWGAIAEPGNEVTYQIGVNGPPDMIDPDAERHDQSEMKNVDVAEPGFLYGTVTDDSGIPVSGAAVTILHQKTGEVITTARTDINGTYGLWIPQEGDYVIAVEAPTHEDAFEQFTVDNRIEHKEVNAEIDTIPEFEFELEAGEPQAIGFPGPVDDTIVDVVGTDVEGVIFAYEADSNEWRQVDPDESPDALEAVVVVPGEETTVTVEIADADGAPDVAQTDVKPGFNFLTAPRYGTPEDAFGVTTDNTTALQVVAAPEQAESAMIPDGTIDGAALVEGTDETVVPFEGYFVFFEGEGTLAGTLTEGVTLAGAYEDLDIETAPAEGFVAADATGQPIDGAYVEIHGASYSAVTADGEFRINHVPTGTDQEATIHAPEAAGTPNFMNEETTLQTGENLVGLDADKLFAVEDVQTDQQVTVDGEIEVEYTVRNVGVDPAAKTVQIEVGDVMDGPASVTDGTVVIDVRELELDPGEAETVTVTASLEDVAIEPGDRGVAVVADAAEQVDDIGFAPVEIVEPEPDADVTFSEQSIVPTDDQWEVLVDGVVADEGDALLFTAVPEDGEYTNELIMGTYEVTEEKNSDRVTVPLEVGGTDVAVHVVKDVSTDSLDDHTLSSDTVDNIVATDTAPVYEVLLEFDDETVPKGADSMTVESISVQYDGELGEDRYHIALRNETDGAPDAFVGVSANDLTLNTEYEYQTVEVLEPRDAGDDEIERSTDTIDENGTYYAVLHIGHAGEVDGERVPGLQPPMVTVSDEGQFIPVVDAGEITAEASDEDQSNLAGHSAPVGIAP